MHFQHFLSIWRHARQNIEFQGSKKVQKSGFKIDREPVDTVPKQTSSMFFSDPEKSMCQKTKATKHVSTPYSAFAKSDYNPNNNNKQQTDGTDFAICFGVCART